MRVVIDARERSRVVAVTGDFSSGTTLAFNLFRASRAYHCLYEPLHELLLEYLVWPLSVDPHHPKTSNYFAEYGGFRQIPHLFDPSWATTGLTMDPDASAAPLHRYLDYLIRESLARQPAAMLKFNRMGFRLGWFRQQFPEARIIHVRRDMNSQWQSLVRRAQENHGREDVGQDSVHFSSFRMGSICDELAGTYPELAAEASASGYERFCKYWLRSDQEQSRGADVTVSLETMRDHLPSALDAIGRCVGFAFDAAASAQVLAGGPEPRVSGGRRWLRSRINRIGRRYAKLHVRARSALLRRREERERSEG